MNHLPLRHCGLDPQSPLYIVVSGNLVKRVCEHKMANVVMTEGVGGLRVKPAMTDGWTDGRVDGWTGGRVDCGSSPQ